MSELISLEECERLSAKQVHDLYLLDFSGGVGVLHHGHNQYFPNSGAEANEGAIKMAYKYHGGKRNTILRADISFHGKTLGGGKASISGYTAAGPAEAGRTSNQAWRQGALAFGKIFV